MTNGNPTDFSTVIAEDPYDDMGREFMDTFGKWVNETTLTGDTRFSLLAFGLFQKRLALAKKYNTFFAKQVTADGKADLWRDRYIGKGNEPCYSFALPQLQRTFRFYAWCQKMENEPSTGIRHWDTSYAEIPSIPLGPHVLNDPMEVWAHKYEPRFTAKSGGAFECRRMRFSDKVILFEHPRSRWISQIRSEAQCFWNMAMNDTIPDFDRYSALASFEWSWYWANPFMRAGAMTGDALSLIVQKHMSLSGMNVHIRNKFYHQDCEALLLPHDVYVGKRIADLSLGFVEKFPM